MKHYILTPKAKTFAVFLSTIFPLSAGIGATIFARQEVGVKEVEDGIWVVSFLDYDLGYFDEMGKRVEPVDNPFKIKVLPMSPE